MSRIEGNSEMLDVMNRILEDKERNLEAQFAAVVMGTLMDISTSLACIADELRKEGVKDE